MEDDLFKISWEKVLTNYVNNNKPKIIKERKQNESATEFIERKQNDTWCNKQQLEAFIKVKEYVKEICPHLPEPEGRCSDGDSYGLYWEKDNDSFVIDIFNWDTGPVCCWIYYDTENDNCYTWDDLKDDSDPVNYIDNDMLEKLKEFEKFFI